MRNVDVTWDGVPVALEDPRGCSIIVWREHGGRREFLVLHRRAAGPPDFSGDWAWTPPAGSRQPGERPDDAARRELREETGLTLELVPTDLGTPAWLVYAAQAPADAAVNLDDEHDRFEWVTAEDAATRCLPTTVGAAVTTVSNLLDER